MNLSEKIEKFDKLSETYREKYEEIVRLKDEIEDEKIELLIEEGHFSNLSWECDRNENYIFAFVPDEEMRKIPFLWKNYDNKFETYDNALSFESEPRNIEIRFEHPSDFIYNKGKITVYGDSNQIEKFIKDAKIIMPTLALIEKQIEELTKQINDLKYQKQILLEREAKKVEE